MNLLLLILIIISTFLIGFLVGRTSTSKSDGMFIINEVDEDLTKWILDVNFDPKDICNRKMIKLKIKRMVEESEKTKEGDV